MLLIVRMGKKSFIIMIVLTQKKVSVVPMDWNKIMT